VDLSLIKEGFKLLGSPGGSIFYVLFILWTIKALREHFSQNRIKHTETLTNLIAYMKENKINDFFIIEQLFLDHFKVQIPYKGIRMFLNSESPTELIFLFKNSRQFVKFTPDYKKIEFFKNLKNQKNQKYIAFSQYVIGGGLGFYMLITGHHFIEYNIIEYIFWFVVSLYFIAVSFLGLYSLTSIDKAKQLVEKYA
jgi:hypothetical protein